MNQTILYINKKLKVLVLSFLLGIFYNGNAVIETYVGATKNLKSFPLTPVFPATTAPLFSECFDSKLIPNLPFNGYSASWNNNFNFKYIKNSIQVSINRTGNNFIGSTSNIRVKLLVWAKDAFGGDIIGNSANTASNIVLDLVYDPNKGVIENDKAIFAFQNAVWFKATVIEITDFNNLIISPMGVNLPDVKLETKIEFDRIYKMDMLTTLSLGFNVFSTSVNLSSNIFAQPNNCQDDKVGCTWANVSGAEEWEIEWQFIEYHNSWSNLSNNNNYLINPTNCDIDFKNNSTRVRINKFTIPNNVILITPMPYFEIPSIYESGYLIIRVRPIGRDITSFEEIYGPWSMSTKSSGNNLTSITSFNIKLINNYNDDLNWQNNVSFAEDGKYKNVISYYDGALRNRQSVTLNTTENTPIIGQTIYDHIGRPTIQVLPTPALDNNPNACFRPNFNKGIGSMNAYNFNNFDLTNTNNCPGNLIVSEMDPTSGASKYYSPNGYNPSTMQTWQAFVPDAKGYPFTQVEFMPDNTGRIARQSGVGPKHRLSGVDQSNILIDGKETKFLYGKPFQEQLFRLFGNEVGKAEHFKRNVTIDPNGQASVTYIDAYGRTVATALAGDPANSNALTPLASSNQSFNYEIKSFVNKTNYLGNSKTIEHTIVVTDPTIYTVEYTVDPLSFTAACTPEGICYDCVYDMEISITDECGMDIIPIENRKALVGNVKPFDLNCNAVSFSLINNLNGLQMLLLPGTYRLSKTLTINKEALEYYKEEMWKNNTCIKTFEDFLAEEKSKLNLKNKCIYTCIDCQDDAVKLIERKTFLTNKGTERTENENIEFLEIEDLIQEQNNLCNELCKNPTPCQILLENILFDISPNNQYAPVSKYDEITKTHSSALNDAVNLLNDDPNRTWESGKDWRHPLNPNLNGSNSDAYYNKDGSIALIKVENNLPEIQSGKNYYNLNGNIWTTITNGSRYIKPNELKNVEDFISNFDPFWAHSLKYYHPEYCYYEKCKYIEPTYEFNNRLLAEDDAEEAKKKGYFNPLNIIDVSNNGISDGQTPHFYSSFEVNNMLDKEPLNNTIINGLVHDKTFWNNHFYAYVQIGNSGTYKSIWDIYNGMVDAANLSSTDKNCVGDAQWPLLRALYISAKNNLLKDYYTNSSNCNNINSLSSNCNNGNCKGNITIPPNKLKRFPLDENDLIGIIDFDKNTNGNTFDNGKKYTEDQIITICADRCESYIEYWKTQLQKCNLYNNLDNTSKDNFILDLKKVCENGCDENNLLGSREVPLYRINDLNGLPENFYQVFEKYFKSTPNWFTAGICDDIILEWPMDYGHDYAAYEGPFSDTCACKKANYAKSNPECEPNDIPAPLNNCACDIKNDEVRQAALMKLDIPDDLKCQNCIDCKAFNEGYSSFIKKYTKSVVNNMADELFIDLVNKWMNFYLGFNLTYEEYLSFAGQCSNVISPSRSVFNGFEEVKFSVLPQNQTKYPDFKSINSEPILYLAKNNSIINELWKAPTDVSLSLNKLKKESSLSYFKTSEPSSDYLLTSNNNDLTISPMPFQSNASSQAEALACNCEKLLTARWYTEKRNNDGLDDISRYNKMFGNSPFGNQGDFDNAYKVCCNAFHKNIPPIPDCNASDFIPGSKFDQSQIDFFDQQILNNQSFPIINPSDYQVLIDNNCNNPLTEDNKLEKLDKCACDKLLDAKRIYELLHGFGSLNNQNIIPSFDSYIYQLYGVSGADFVKLTERCDKFWKSGAGEDNNGVLFPWTGLNANWKKISLVNLAEDAEDEDLQVPKGLLCLPPGPPPPTCKQWLPSCNELIHILAQFLANNPPPPNMYLGANNPNDPGFRQDLFYENWKLFHESFLNNKSASSPDPTFTSFFDAFAAFANNHPFIKKSCPTPASFSVELLLGNFQNCMPESCGPDCKDFEYVFNLIKQSNLDKNPRPLGFDETTTWSKEWHTLIWDNYHVNDQATLDYIDDYVEEFNILIGRICARDKREFSFEEIWVRMKDCFIWNEYNVPAKPAILPPKCTTCYLVDEDYLTAFQNTLNKITKGDNSFQPNLEKLNFDNWKLINLQRDVFQFYDSKLYRPNSDETNLKYRINEDNYGVPYMEVEIIDNTGFVLSFSLQFLDNQNIYNFGYIKKFSNIKALKRIGCGLAKAYELDAEIIIPDAYYSQNPTKTIKMRGTFYKGGYASYTDCWNTCVRLCNKPQIPSPKIEDDPCDLALTRIAYSNALHEYENYKDEINKKFESDYIKHCMGVNEDFTLKFNQKEYHYTLYYYDQAGNLIKTVPPEGVDITNAYMTKTCSGNRNTLINNSIQQDFGNERIDAAKLHFDEPSAHPRVITSHTLITNYKYNTLNQLIWQSTPDGGESRFWYDNLGRLVVSQNAKQLAANKYSYSLYDALGRITEVGEKTTTNSIDYEIAGNLSQLNVFLSSGTNREVTRTFYDALTDNPSNTIDPANNEFTNNNRQYLRHRVVSTHFFKETPPTGTYQGFGSDAATHYSYDIHGNVNELLQENAALDKINLRYKKIEYDYDLISGNVKQVHYQKEKPDQMHHRYFYDADNRLTLAETSRDGWNYTLEAKYFYYLHGPLARTELGDYNQKVQGLDYAYTIHGWLKSVNGASLNHEREMGKDGHYTMPNNANAKFGRDAFSFMLHYYDGDYSLVGGPTRNFVPDMTGSNILNFKNDLFNGNIPFMQTSLPDVNSYNANGAVVNSSLGNLYQYDQLNRLVEHRVFNNFDNTSNNWLNTPLNNGTDKFYENFTYDANGNILNINRNGANTGSGLAMDNFTYHYNNDATSQIIKPSITSTGYCVFPMKSNKLYHVNDAIAPSNYTDDIDDQGTFTLAQNTINTANNYGYDEIGNLVRDNAENIQNIEWNAYGKIESITRNGNNNKANLAFAYDATGQRISKLVMPRLNGVLSPQKDWTNTFYVRDATGNVMATYSQTYTELIPNQKIKEEIKLNELHLYASSRLGTYNANQSMATQEYNIAGYHNTNKTFVNQSPLFNTLQTTTVTALPTVFTVYKGKKQYELSNHLGNVLATISDRRVPRDDNGDLIIDYFNADILSTSDYYAFGSSMSERAIGGYRYGFNGKELDKESFYDAYDFGARIYDGRIGRWLSVDPLASMYVSYSPYCFVLNTPINAFDPNGELVIFSHGFILQDGLTNRKSSKNGEKIYKEDFYGEGAKNNDYWGCMDEGFMNSLNDFNSIYVNGESGMLSQASNRADQGAAAAQELHQQILKGEVVLQTNSAGEIIETITLVGHSQGAAYAAGMATELIKLGYKVDAVYYVTPHQPGDIIHPDGVLGVQYSHPLDKVSSKAGLLPNGGSKLADIQNITEVKTWQNPAWNLKIMGDRGGHNVGLNYEIFSIKKEDIGYIRPKPTDNTPISQGKEIKLDMNKSSNLWGW